MIAHNVDTRENVWHRIAEPIPVEQWSWRQDGRASERQGKFFARFVPYIEFPLIFRRLMATVPGEFDITLDQLPVREIVDKDGMVKGREYAAKCRIQVLGVIREDVGVGKDYKQAATDSVKRAAMRFGIGLELYESEPLFVQVDGDGKYAKALEDPAVAYARRYGRTGSGEQRPDPTTDSARSPSPRTGQSDSPPSSSANASPQRRESVDEQPFTSDVPACPKCSGRMWDNRLTKRNPKAPDFKCRDRACEGVVWPPKPGQPQGAKQAVSMGPDLPGEYDEHDDEDAPTDEEIGIY